MLILLPCCLTSSNTLLCFLHKLPCVYVAGFALNPSIYTDKVVLFRGADSIISDNQPSEFPSLCILSFRSPHIPPFIFGVLSPLLIPAVFPNYAWYLPVSIPGSRCLLGDRSGGGEVGGAVSVLVFWSLK